MFTLNTIHETLDNATIEQIIELAAYLNTAHGYELKVSASKEELIDQIEADVDLDDLLDGMEVIFKEEGDDEE